MSAKRKKKSKSSKNSSVVLLFCTAFIVLIIVILLFIQSPKVVLSEDLIFEVGQEIRLSDVVTEVQNGVLVDPDKVLNSEKEGSQTVLFEVKNSFGFTKKESVVISFVKEGADSS